MNEKTLRELQQASSVSQMFDVLKKNYDLENCKPGIMVKSTVIAGLKSAIKMLRPNER